MRKYFVFLVALFILGACGTSPPVVIDWCITYDFSSSSYGIALSSGNWVDGLGLLSQDGLLQFSYDYGEFVVPNKVEATVNRTSENNVDVTANGVIYGVSASFSATMTTDEETVTFYPAVLGDGGTGMNVSIDSGVEELVLQSILVTGSGASPFPTNPCSLNTPSPTIPPTTTGTATEDPLMTNTPTDTPTLTETPSPTFTPSNTPPPGTYTFPFDYDLQDYTYSNLGYGDRGGWASGYDTATGVITANYWSDIAVYGHQIKLDVASVLPASYLITKVDVSYYMVGTHDSHMYYIDQDEITPLDTQLLGVGGYYMWATHSWTGLSVTDPTVILSFGSSYADTLMYVDSVTIHYSYDFSTPTPSNTPTASDTPTRTPIATPTSGGFTKTPIGYASPTPISGVDLSLTPLATASTTLTATGTRTPLGTSTPFLTATIPAGTGTPTHDQDVENQAEYSILGAIGNFFDWIRQMFSDFFGWLAGIFNAIFGWLNDFVGWITSIINFFLNLFSQIIALILDFLGIILLIINLILGLVGLLLLYIGQAIARMSAFISAFFTAPATPINGLPLCVSDPFSYDICAIYYIMDWTLFAPGTPGQFIMPLLLTMMNVVLIFRFVKYVLKIIKKGEDIEKI